MKYRSTHDIAATLLDTAREPVSKTVLMYKSYLSYTQLGFYIPRLVESGLLREYDGRYQATDKGLKFLCLYDDMKGLVNFKD